MASVLFVLLCGVDVILTKIGLSLGCIEFNQIGIMQNLWWRLDIALLIVLVLHLARIQRSIRLLCFGIVGICCWNASQIILSL